ncbi:AAA family ATPase [Lachnospira sp.]|jgi:hypothetical protein|uniref:AAA family ATPase n=1 Tax=Lachnospira sp. TaxID=2049031 RepID=UPI00257B06D8|nr:ATP-binding protein [Lachnospira sp.]
MFVGRKKELNSLEKIYSSPKFGMTVIYGRRRIGKTFLITEFLKEKMAIFYTATKLQKYIDTQWLDKNLMIILCGSSLSFMENKILSEGTWWGVEQLKDKNNNRYQQSADIDVVGISTVDNTAIVGEYKFKNEKIDKTIYETLIRRSKLITGKYAITHYLLFYSLVLPNGLVTLIHQI